MCGLCEVMTEKCLPQALPDGANRVRLPTGYLYGWVIDSTVRAFIIRSDHAGELELGTCHEERGQGMMRRLLLFLLRDVDPLPAQQVYAPGARDYFDHALTAATAEEWELARSGPCPWVCSWWGRHHARLECDCPTG